MTKDELVEIATLACSNTLAEYEEAKKELRKSRDFLACILSLPDDATGEGSVPSSNRLIGESYANDLF